MFNAFSVSVYGMTSATILAILPTADDANKISALDNKGLIAFVAICLGLTVIYLHKQSQAQLAAQLVTQTKTTDDILAHHNAAVITMNTERKEYRDTLTSLIANNTAAFTSLTDAVENLRQR